MAQLLAFDVGKVRTGIAATDDLQLIASPLTTIVSEELFDFIKDYTSQNRVEAFVVGMPMNTDGKETDGTKFVNQFVEKLKKNYPSVPIHFVDERFTSKMAFQAMIDGGLSKKKRRDKATIDKVAAAIILQSFMEDRESNSKNFI